jgi:CelD/BcsL family acetyltransferase involved in cellulose biosynthesis
MARMPPQQLVRTFPELGPLVPEWEALAREAGSPFMTHVWLSCWWRAFGNGVPVWLVLLDADGSLRAGGMLHRRRGRLAAGANVHSGDWDMLARDESARAALWAAASEMGATRIHLEAMHARTAQTRSACAALEQAGYQIVPVEGPFCPWLALPSTWEELMRSVSSGLRQQIRRRRRNLERRGLLAFSTITGGSKLDRYLDAFLELEASGWKGEAGTAILSDASTESLYRDFAHAAASEGWLRLHLLELDGALIAGSFDCTFASRAYLLKTTFSEAHSDLSPGLVLLAEVLRSAIADGLQAYDFLGDPDAYKLRWTSELHPRTQIFAYRGIARPGYLYRKSLRPFLKSARAGVKRPGLARKR